jgi:hypothetical protein
MRIVLAGLIAAASVARADVIFEEPTQLTCGRATIIVAGTIDGTTRPGPFTNANPPVVKLTATDCWKGCNPGEHLEIAQWVDPKPSHSGKPHPSDPQAEQAAWERATVQPPAPGTKVMLFLRRDGAQLLRVQDSGGYGGFVMVVGGNEKQMQRSAGMCEIAVTIAGARDRTVAGTPVMLHVEVTNRSGTAAVFHAESLTLTLRTDTRPGEDLSPTWTPLAPLTLDAGTQRGFDWNLRELFPGEFAKPGTYWLTLDAPAALGLHAITIAVQ